MLTVIINSSSLGERGDRRTGNRGRGARKNVIKLSSHMSGFMHRLINILAKRLP